MMDSKNKAMTNSHTGNWLIIVNGYNTSKFLLIEPWGVGCEMPPGRDFYVYMSCDNDTPKLIYQDEFIIAHSALALLDSNKKELYNFADFQLPLPEF